MSTRFAIGPVITKLCEIADLIDGLDEPERSMLAEMVERVTDRAMELYGSVMAMETAERAQLVLQTHEENKRMRAESRRLISEAKARGELK